MQGELITIGNELVSGLVTNTNAAYIGRVLLAAHFPLRWVTVVGDDQEDIVAAIRQALTRASFVIITGGLGPTDDDLTVPAAAKALQLNLRRDPCSWEVLSQHLKEKNLQMTSRIAKMADLPEGAQRIDLQRPRAGFYLRHLAKPLFFLPGVPEEMIDMMKEFVLPKLRSTFPLRQVYRWRHLRIFGLRESQVNDLLADFSSRYPAMQLGLLPVFPEVLLQLTIQAASDNEAEAILQRAVARVRQQLGLHLYGEDDETMEKVVGRLLRERRETVALAESCTGGLISHLLTNVPGSSAYFEESLVTYSDSAKITSLQVPAETICRCSAVSAQTAEAMLNGLRQKSHATIMLAVTGYAGPEAGGSRVPVGTTFIALSYKNKFRLQRFRFSGSRSENKTLAAYTGLDWMRRAMIDDEFFNCEPA